MKQFIDNLNSSFEEQKTKYREIRKNTYCRRTEMDDCDSCRADHYLDARLEGINKAKEIVNQLAAEYKGGWIPCNVKLPTVSNSYLVTKMCENDGNPIYETAHEIFWRTDGKWDCERDEYCDWRVIAWQEKLAPYKPGGKEKFELSQKEAFCDWIEMSQDVTYKTSCGEEEVYFGSYKFCPHCSKMIRLIKQL